MADEHVIKIEFEGDDQDGQRPQDDQRHQDTERREQRAADEERSTDAYDEANRRNEERRSREDQRRREEFEREQVERDPVETIFRRTAESSDETLDVPEPPPLVEPAGIEEPAWRAHESESRAIVPYDWSQQHRSHEQITDANSFSDDEWGSARPANVTESTVTTAGSSPGEAATGMGGPPVEPPMPAAGPPDHGMYMAEEGMGAAGIAELLPYLGKLAEYTTVAAGALGGMAFAVYETTEALGRMHDNLLSEFEQLSPEIASARAVQNAELIQQRIATGQDIGAGAADTIEGQTGVEKELIKIRGHLVKMVEVILLPLYIVVQKGLHYLNRILQGLEKALTWLGLMHPHAGGVHRFQQEAEDFLGNLPQFVGGRHESRWGRRHPNKGDTSFP